ncbi:MAG TPA: DUF3006 domain-containing protein [Blastocatellia bacterium]|nr:DUF3006 domain-containing protein [Blastocatellia bacterium]
MKKESTVKVEIDRVEDGIAVVVLSDDDEVKFSLPAKYLPEGARDGDHLRLIFKVDERGREETKARVSDLLKELKGGRDDKSDA